MTDVVMVTEVAATKNLAHHLKSASRSKPVVVISVKPGESQPWIDVNEVVSQVGNLVEVFVLANVETSWEFARHMPEGTQVYGGAGRVYPANTNFLSNNDDSPLRMVFDSKGGKRATKLIISDALNKSFASEIVSQSFPLDKSVSGVVTGFAADQAIVKLDGGGYANIIPELTVEGFQGELLFRRGQLVSGRLNIEAHRLDVTASLLRSDDALKIYS